MPDSSGLPQADLLHPLVGYCGMRQAGALEQLRQTLQRCGLNHQAIRQGQLACPDSPEQICWVVASLNSTQGFEPLQPEQEIHIALSAGGIATNQQSDSSLLPDAWIRLIHTSGAVQLELGRDRFGRVPLYWTQRQQTVWFASRLQLLLPQNPEIDPAALFGYTCFSYVPTPLTPVRSIHAVPAGVPQIWRWEGAKLTRSEIQLPPWQEREPPIHDESTAVEQLQTLLEAAVCRQVADLDDAPVGVFLSGGLDSSVVAALLVQMGLKVRAYSLDFGLGDRSELGYAEQVAQFLNIPLTQVDATPKRIRRAIAPTAKALDLPFGDGVTVPLYLLNQAAAQETAVVFNGEHGDQLFAGWPNKPLIAAGIYSAVRPDSGSIDPFSAQYLKTFHRLHGHERQIFQLDFAAQCDLMNPIDWLQEALDPQFSTGLLHRLRRANLMLKGAQNIQPRATALATAHGLKVRSPFCDLPLAEWTFRLSGELCLRGSCEKYILKRAVEPWLPPEIVWRSKRGMGVPLTLWCLNELWRDLGDWLNPATLRAQSHLQPHVAAQLASGRLGADIQGRRIGECLWLLLMWQAWRVTNLGDAQSPRSWNHPFWLPPQFWREVRRWRDLW